MNDTPSTDPVIYCARHPKQETLISCASCGTPICPKCMVSTPVGMKCPDCGLSRGGALYHVGAGRLILAGITALFAGFGALIVGHFGFFMILIAVPYGYFVGSMIVKAAGMKRGRSLEIVAVAGMVLGALSPNILAVMLTGKLIAAIAALPPLFSLIAVGVAIACALSKVRYL